MPMYKRTLPRRAAGVLRAAPLALGAFFAVPIAAIPFVASCVVPENDYNDYVSRAADAKGPPSSTGTSEAGAVDAALLHAPDSSFMDQKYAMACLTQLDPATSNALLWVANLSYTPAASGGGGMVSLTLQSLTAGATNVGSPLGSAQSASATVDSKGVAPLMFGTVSVLPAANAVTGGAATLSNTELQLEIEADQSVCGQLSGVITSPPPTVTLNQGSNPCVLLKTDGSGNIPPLQLSAFHCP
jgi:hypothetical protein